MVLVVAVREPVLVGLLVALQLRQGQPVFLVTLPQIRVAVAVVAVLAAVETVALA
jgi:hypothetical protein